MTDSLHPIDVLRRHLPAVTLAALVGALGGAAVVMVKPRLYQTTAMIAVGKVPLDQSERTGAQFVALEDGEEVVERLKSRSVLEALFPGSQDVARIRVEASAQGTMVRLTAKGPGAEETRRVVDALWTGLEGEHRALLADWRGFVAGAGTAEAGGERMRVRMLQAPLYARPSRLVASPVTEAMPRGWLLHLTVGAIVAGLVAWLSFYLSSWSRPDPASSAQPATATATDHVSTTSGG